MLTKELLKEQIKDLKQTRSYFSNTDQLNLLFSELDNLNKIIDTSFEEKRKEVSTIISKKIDQYLKYKFNNDYAEMNSLVKNITNKSDIIQNNIATNLNDIVTNKAVMFQFIKPNKLNILTDLAQNLQEDLSPSRRNSLWNIETKAPNKYSPTDVMYPYSGMNYEVTKQWGKSLGKFALTNKMLSYIKQHDITQNKQFEVFFTPSTSVENISLESPNFDKKSVTLLNTNPLLSKEIPYSSERNEDGTLKAYIIDEGLTGTVDASSDPTFASFGITSNDIGLFISLIKEGVAPKKAAYFLKSNVIDTFNNHMIQNNISGVDVKKTALALLGEGKFNNLNYYNTINRYNSSFKTTEEELISKLNDFVETDSLKTPIYSEEQRSLLGYYLVLQERAKVELGLQTAMQIDTKKIQNTYDANDKKTQLDNVIDSGLFEGKGVNDFFENNFLKPHANDGKEFIKLMNVVSNNLYNSQLLNMSSVLSKKLQNITSKERLFNSFQGNFITFLFDKYVKYNGNNLEAYRQELLIKDSVNKQTTVEEFYKLLSKHPELQTNEFVKVLIPSIHPNLQEVHNFSGSDTVEKTVDNYDIIHEAYNSLLNNKDKGIANTFLKIGHLAYLQSGLNYSSINFTKFITSAPFESMTESMLNSWKAEENKSDIINEFYDKFIRQNKELLGVIDKKDGAPLLEEQRYVTYADNPFTATPIIADDTVVQANPIENTVDKNLNTEKVSESNNNNIIAKKGDTINIETSENSFNAQLKTFKQEGNNIELSYINKYNVQVGYKGEIKDGKFYPNESFNPKTGWKRLSTATFIKINFNNSELSNNLPDINTCG